MFVVGVSQCTCILRCALSCFEDIRLFEHPVTVRSIKYRIGGFLIHVILHSGFQATAQLISAYAALQEGAAGTQLDYLMRTEINPEPTPHSISAFMSSALSMKNIGGGMSSAASAIRRR